MVVRYKRAKIVFIVMALFLSTSLLHCMQQSVVQPYIYNGQKITPETILPLVPQIPEDIKSAAVDWLNKEYDLISRLTQFSYSGCARSFSTANLQHSNNCLILRKNNMSLQGNYVFILPCAPEYIAKISGLTNRAANLIAHKVNKNNGSRDFNVLDEGPTFQTISSVASLLRIQEVIKQHALTKIKTASTYLLHIPWQPRELSDDNYIILQERVDGVALLNEKRTSGVSDQAVKELFCVIKNAGLWNLHDLLVDACGTIFVVDLAQPVDSDPSHFFHKNSDAYQRNVNAGTRGAEILFKNSEIIKNICGKDTIRPRSGNYTDRLRRAIRMPVLNKQ